MSSGEELAPWDVWTLPTVDQHNTDPETDRVPTPDGAVRCYYGDELMHSIGGRSVEFSVGFDNDPGEPAGLVFDAPVAMFEDDEPTGPALRTLMTEDSVPITETNERSPHRRTWVPEHTVSWDFEITLETTPYTADSGGESE